MSSHRVMDRCAERLDVDAAAEWTIVEPPQPIRDLPSAAGIIVALAGVRAGYDSDERSLDLDESAEYGGGDPELANDIEQVIERSLA